MARWQNNELRLSIPVKFFPAFVLNEYVLSGLGGQTREESFERMIASWYETNNRLLEKRGVTVRRAEELGYIPFEPWSDEEVESLREERLETQDLSDKEFNLNLLLSGIPAYLFEKIPSSGIIELVSSDVGLARRMVFDWYSKETKLLRKLDITRDRANQEGYLPRRRA